MKTRVEISLAQLEMLNAFKGIVNYFIVEDECLYFVFGGTEIKIKGSSDDRLSVVTDL